MSSIDLNRLCLGCMNMLPHPKAVCPVCNWSRKNSQNNTSQLPQGIDLTSNTTGTQYRLGKVLGQGGFGIVYIAWDMTNNRKVAVKEYFPSQFVARDHSNTVVLQTDNQNNRYVFDKQKKRFREEAAKMQMFQDSPNVVNVLDFFDANGTSYIVMEFIAGRTLAQILSNIPNGRLSFDSVVTNLKPIVDILERIHRTPWSDDNGVQHSGIIHRDISPENIMYAADGSVKLLDFGAARVSDPNDPPTGIVKPGYAPYEQQLSVPGPDSAQGTWSDVYSFAATIYRAITGEIPPNAVSRNSSDTLIPPTAFGIEITPEQERVLLKGLAVKYQNRYQDIRQFYNDLTRVVVDNGNVNTQPPPTPPPQSNPPTPPPTDTDNGLTTKILWAVAAIALIAAILIHNKAGSHESELNNIRSQIQTQQTQLARYQSFAADYGYASSSYYAEKPIVFLDRNSEGKISIYCSLLKDDLKASWNLIDGNDVVSVRWDEKWYDTNKIYLIVTSGNNSGFATIRLTNQANSDSFDVLAVVQ